MTRRTTSPVVQWATVAVVGPPMLVELDDGSGVQVPVRTLANPPYPTPAIGDRVVYTTIGPRSGPQLLLLGKPQ